MNGPDGIRCYSYMKKRLSISTEISAIVCLLWSFAIPLSTFAQRQSDEPLQLRIATAESEQVSAPATYGARIRPGEEYSVGAPISGFLESVAPRIGDTVRVGEEIATIQRSSPGEEFRPATVQARFSGTVVSLQVRPGEYVGSGQELLRLADTGSRRLLVRVSDRDIADINEGDRSAVVVPSTGEEITGAVSRVYPEADFERGLFTVEVDLAGNGRRIGAYAEVTFRVRPFTGVLVPATAVTEREGGAFLYAVEDGVARRRQVTVAGEYGERIALSGGLEPGEEYVASQAPGLRDGRAVTPDPDRGGSRPNG
ncbi:MAG: efflux RND transporter periplasmic adaptor subunit [Alkalispirochaetaceae bacterium]